MSEMYSWSEYSFFDKILLNHKVKLQQGEVYPFIDMPSVGVGMRAPERVRFKEYTGGGVKFSRNDTLIARIEPCLQNGKRFYFREGDVGFGSTEYIVFSPKDDSVDPMFLFYYLNQERTNRRFESAMAGTSGRRRVDTSFLDSYRILLPGINNQKKIAAVLSIIDDKIELNRRLNDNLEAMAQALYDYWFVQFDFPDENGKPYKTSGGKMVWNEVLKREIPDGWEVCAIKDILNPQKAPFRLDAKQYKQAGLYPIFDQATDNYIAGYTDNPDVLQNTYPAVIFGDHSCTVKLAPSPYARGADGTQVMTTSHPNLPVYYFYRYIKSTKVPNPGYSRHFKFLKSSFIIIPDNEIVARFNAAVGCIEEKVWILHQERQNLSIHRDFLLPLLMNGQVQVKPLNYRLTAD